MLGCMGRNTITTNTEQVPSYLHYDSVDEYFDFMSEESSYGGQLEIYALGEFLRYNIDVVTEKNGQLVGVGLGHTNSSAGDRSILLYHNLLLHKKYYRLFVVAKLV